MNRRMLLHGALALPLAAWPVGGLLAAPVDVTAINNYLVALRAARGRFVQTNPNGSRQSGNFYLAKPGRIRFEYDRPEGAMVIADGNWVGVFDPKSNRNPTRYPLSRTPLSILLRDKISLREPGLVLGARRNGNGVHITVVDPRAPQEGRMIMTFGEAPVQLKQWEITTKAGARTRVALTEIQSGGSFQRSLFNIELEAAKYR